MERHSVPGSVVRQPVSQIVVPNPGVNAAGDERQHDELQQACCLVAVSLARGAYCFSSAAPAIDEKPSCPQSGGRSYLPPCRTTLRGAMTGAVLLAKCPLPETFTAFLHRRTEQSCESVFLLDEVGVPPVQKVAKKSSLSKSCCPLHYGNASAIAQSSAVPQCTVPVTSRLFGTSPPFRFWRMVAESASGTSARGFCHSPPYCIGFIS